MKLFGFNISRSPQTPEPTTRSIDPNLAAWLKGETVDTSPCLSNAYQQVVWVYRAINVLAEQVANIPFLFSAGDRGRETLITTGPLHQFYDHPHPHLNRFQYWELRVMWLMLRGECFRLPIYRSSSSHPVGTTSTSSPFGSSIKNRNSKIKNIVYLDPARMHHVIQDHRLVGWRYTAPGQQGPLSSQVFLPEEIWFERLPNPFDFWRGMPPLMAADLPARTDYAAASFMRGLMENNADLGVIVHTDQPLNDEQQEQVLAKLRERKRRAGTADRPLLLCNGAQITKPQLSSADMEFLNNRKFSRSEICAAFGVPEEIVTTTDKAKYDVMAGARLNFIENRVAPLCARLEAEEDATVKAIDPGAVGWFDVDSLPIMQEARRHRLAAAKTGFDMGIPLNELNRVFDLGFKSFPWGDTGYLKSNLTPAGTTTEESK